MKFTYLKPSYTPPAHRHGYDVPGCPRLLSQSRRYQTQIPLVKIAIAILFVICFSGCEKHPFISLLNKNQNKVIALQPFGNFRGESLASISKEISTFFHIRVVILKPVDIPATCHLAKGESYSADSIIMFLSTFINDTIADVVGLTHSDIYTIRQYNTYENNVPVVLYEPKGVFGYGYVSGGACVVSDHRLMTANQQLVSNRLKKIIIHEIGHNLGLSHCARDTCVMFEGDIPTLDRCNGNYCNKCRHVLN